MVGMFFSFPRSVAPGAVLANKRKEWLQGLGLTSSFLARRIGGRTSQSSFVCCCYLLPTYLTECRCVHPQVLPHRTGSCDSRDTRRAPFVAQKGSVTIFCPCDSFNKRSQAGVSVRCHVRGSHLASILPWKEPLLPPRNDSHGCHEPDPCRTSSENGTSMQEHRRSGVVPSRMGFQTACCMYWYPGRY